MRMGTVIAAVSTAMRTAAIGVVRVSGDDAVKVCEKVFFPLRKRAIAETPRMAVLGDVHDDEGKVIDSAIATYFKAPASYTGEDMVEISCHGGVAVISETLAALFAAGAEQAEPGEFTRRAFLNGKLDLTQAEAVADLLSARTKQAAENAAFQLGGSLGRELKEVRHGIVDIAAHFYAFVDFPDEGVEDFCPEEKLPYLMELRDRLEKLKTGFRRAEVYHDGVECAIIGRPNVGKSSLLNAILGYDRSIVDNEAGTTRDTVEASAVVGGVLLNIIDTAGLRDDAGRVESIGVERSRTAAQKAELVLFVVDGSEPPTDEEIELAREFGENAICVVNKADLEQFDRNEVTDRFHRVCVISAKTGEGMDELGNAVSEAVFAGETAETEHIMTNPRQRAAVIRAAEALDEAIAAIHAGMTADALCVDLESAAEELGAVTGENVSDDVISEIFSHFCVGK